jgi:tetratricopeptide (TPR) repeat protein
MPNRPGINNNGNHNTVINRPVNRTNINNINQHNNYFNHSTNVIGNQSAVANRINDWNGAWYDNYSAWNRGYHPWYNGAWHGNAFNNWGVGPVTWGMSAWGLNSIANTFGYSSYSNPFYVPPSVVVEGPQPTNYSQPIINVVQALPESGQEPPPMPETAAQAFDTAMAEFKRGNYRTALEKTEQAMKEFPNDPAMHEYRALCLFALGEYRQASAAVHSILASGPGWDWTTLQSLYPDTDTYVNQLSALEKAASANPNDSALQFLLAYHYITANQPDAAKQALTRLLTLLPTDRVVNQLAQSAGVHPQKAEPKVPTPPVDVQLDITGDWAATRSDGGKIGLSIKPEGGFHWSVADKSGKKEAFDGTFSLEDNVLILERSSGGALMGRVTALADNRFNFKVLGGGDADPGLTFAK